MTRDEAQAWAKELNWEPPNHSDMPGYIPDTAWAQWRTFEAVAVRDIGWRKVDNSAWRAVHAAEWSPDYEAVVEGSHYVLEQHIYHGFPDPPEWGLYVMDVAAKTVRCLGCVDYWPVNWRVADN